MKSISIFYHIWSPANTDYWRFLVDEQLKRLYNHKLDKHANIYCAISGPSANIIEKYVSLHNWIKIIEVSENDQEYEGLTLKHLFNHVKEVESIESVMYFHTKGISHLSGQSSLCSIPGIDNERMFRAVNSWRHQMEWGVIDQWKAALEKLIDNQVVGVNYCITPWPHMSGNFWWATADYIRTLTHPTLDEYAFDPNDFGNINRMKYEKWIGTGNPKVFSFHNAPFGYEDQEIKPDIMPKSFEPQYFWLYRDDLAPHFRLFLNPEKEDDVS